MSNIVFKTGKPHQEQTAIWARRRLADKGGRCFSSPDDQDGVLFADGVGLGKTWEAIAAAALILCKDRCPQKGRRHVLILCPANLVTKWEDELCAGSPLRKKLEAWAASKKGPKWAVPAQRVLETLTQVFPIRSAKHVPMKSKYGKFRPPGGTYIISQSLIVGQSRKLADLRREEWDIVIVDEAHNASARKALLKIQERRRARTKLLLTATPFQLEPRQLHTLAKNLVKRSHEVLKRKEIASYLDQLSDVFESPEKPSPSRQTVKAAGNTLRKLAARSLPRSQNRSYEMLMLDGTSKSLPQRLDSLDDHALQEFLSEFRQDNEQARDRKFELAYFKERLRLATKQESTYVATRLRRLLSAGTSDHESPRRSALARWARTNFLEDIRRALETGLPHKTLVFTAWVGKGNRGEAAALQRLLAESFARALGDAKRVYGTQWHDWTVVGRDRLQRKAKEAGKDRPKVAEALEALSHDELTCALAGRSRRFAFRLASKLEAQAEVIATAEESSIELKRNNPGSFEARALCRRIRDMKSKLSPWTTKPALGAVERYTGNERRSARDRVATAFREVGPPWVVVASNVGSEGIDLHTYTARIIHYDLEWNPAKMEQREGRGDRVGRLLHDKLAILYCLVPRTYDERMFHQLVARERWHGVLLGKPAIKLDDAQTDARAIDHKRIARMRLDLTPRKE
jgi:superfamily II DNA or RNA helicase